MYEYGQDWSIKTTCFQEGIQPQVFFISEIITVDNDANKHAWMMSILYLRWLQKVNKWMQRKKKKILVFVDNCHSHPKIERLSNVTVVFLSPNTTSKLQPMDQGIIWNFKMNYRRLLIERLIESHDK